MADVIIVGDGPAGLSAALFLGKRGMDVRVYGTDETLVHKAMLYNYLGIPAIDGSEFMLVAREQVQRFGVNLIEAEVTSAAQADSGFSVTTADGQTAQARYLLLTTGRKRDLAQSLGVELAADGSVPFDRDGRTSVDNLYSAGWSVRPDKVQAIISAGDGAAAALDILSKEAGKDLHDFDVPDKA